MLDTTFFGLTVLSAFTSFITACMGAGGGAILIAVMALILPPAAVIPVHGLVQLGSNIGRALLSWRHINWKLLAVFVPFSFIGAWLASLFLVQLPSEVLQLAIAVFVLYLCWGPAMPKVVAGNAGLGLGGLGTGFISLFVGASGPLVAAFIKPRSKDRFQSIATFAATMSCQHAAKGVAFGVAGFVFKPWWPLIFAMFLASIFGNWLGLKLLGRISEARFHRLFQVVLTLLAIQLLWEASAALLGH
ncbi:sulfite exporter TauE/SafE family protein [Gallaecimonas mangrovi]|uniref:sulfite exporter TauE/SafE family protein n=1 Tax=Gallaecimonas mangrovi TaxID=2291597 RepID=UPI000E2097E0|nr:sulfite exporter TauE/SafE family protein [Gallaecimonas mangrovi]